MVRVALGQPHERKAKTLEQPMFLQGLNRIMGAGRIKTTGHSHKGGQISLIDFDDGNNYIYQHS
jgi:hypothetical protein